MHSDFLNTQNVKENTIKTNTTDTPAANSAQLKDVSHPNVCTLYLAPKGNAQNQYCKTFDRVHRIRAVDEWQHVDAQYSAVKFNEKGRADANFVAADCIVMDVDNMFTAEDLQNGATPYTIEDISKAFPQVTFYWEYSRNSGKTKTKDGPRVNGQKTVITYAPCDRFHVVMPLGETITDLETYKHLKQKAAELFPGFDKNATQASQMTFTATDKPDSRRGVVEGYTTVLRFIEAHEEEAKYMAQLEEETQKAEDDEEDAYNRAMQKMKDQDAQLEDVKEDNHREDDTQGYTLTPEQHELYMRAVRRGEIGKATKILTGEQVYFMDDDDKPLAEKFPDMDREEQQRRHALYVLWLIDPNKLDYNSDDEKTKKASWIKVMAAAIGAGITWEEFSKWCKQDPRHQIKKDHEKWKGMKRDGVRSGVGSLVVIARQFRDNVPNFFRWQVQQGFKPKEAGDSLLAFEVDDRLERIKEKRPELFPNPSVKWSRNNLIMSEPKKDKSGEIVEPSHILKNQVNCSILLYNTKSVPEFRFNGFRMYPEQRSKEKPGATWEPVDEMTYATHIDTFIRTEGLEFSKAMISNAIDAILDSNRYNPLQEMFKNLPEWDGVPRVESLLSTYLGAEDCPFYRAAIRMTMAAAYARVYQPGLLFQYMLILAGSQGAGKSTFIRMLSAEKLTGLNTYTDFNLDAIGEKDAKQQIGGAWFVECAEMDGVTKVTQGKLKGWITAQEDTYRAPYGRITLDHPRKCVLFGTANQVSGLLRDPSGGRRYLVVTLPQMSAEQMIEAKKHRPNPATESAETLAQIWAEVKECWTTWPEVELMESGQIKIDLTDDMKLAAEAARTAVQETDADAERVRDYLDRMPIPKDWNKWTYTDMYLYYKAWQKEKQPGTPDKVLDALHTAQLAYTGYYKNTAPKSYPAGPADLVHSYFWDEELAFVVLGTPEHPADMKSARFKTTVDSLNGWTYLNRSNRTRTNYGRKNIRKRMPDNVPAYDPD